MRPLSVSKHWTTRYSIRQLFKLELKQGNKMTEESKKTKWDGASMSQNDFMEKDTVLVLDEDDNIIGSESKKGSHIFNSTQPRGVLHRAFSVFIFDESTNELLLQQRAASKITFPSVSVNKIWI